MPNMQNVLLLKLEWVASLVIQYFESLCLQLFVLNVLLASILSNFISQVYTIVCITVSSKAFQKLAHYVIVETCIKNIFKKSVTDPDKTQIAKFNFSSSFNQVNRGERWRILVAGPLWVISERQMSSLLTHPLHHASLGAKRYKHSRLQKVRNSFLKPYN